VQADCHAVRPAADRQIDAPPGCGRALESRGDEGLGKAGALQGMDDRFALPRQRGGEGQMLDGTAAALSEQGAGRFYPVRAAAQDRQQVGRTGIERFYTDMFARQGAGNEQGSPFGMRARPSPSAPSALISISVFIRVLYPDRPGRSASARTPGTQSLTGIWAGERERS
jgi:hypothetical protein